MGGGAHPMLSTDPMGGPTWADPDRKQPMLQ
jgi:hypothetical protein